MQDLTAGTLYNSSGLQFRVLPLVGRRVAQRARLVEEN